MTALTEPFNPITLDQLDRVKLMNRVDTKILIPEDLVNDMLTRLSEQYRVLEIDGRRQASYESLYYDTPELHMYNEHHNGKLNRYKIRYRKYLDSDLSFLEVKKKNSKERTIKTRRRQEDLAMTMDGQAQEFVDTHVTGFDVSSLVPVLRVCNQRITLAHATKEERVTIDLGLHFLDADGESRQDAGRVAIVEIKQPKFTMNSPVMDYVRKIGQRPTGFSKYCIGSILTNKHIRKNRFKEQLLKLQKI